MAKSKGIKNPEVLWELFEDYKRVTKQNPILVHDFVGKDGYSTYREKEQALTMVGMYNYCRRNASDAHHYFEDTDERYKEYRGICRAIRDEIREDQITRGLAGVYNPSITQRLNGLKEQTEATITVEQPLFGEDD